MGVDRTATLLQPRLNYDTLLHILSFLEERRDISSFMKTCKSLCHHATLRLLDHHRGAVRIKNVPQAISFCMFMVPNLGNLDRLRYLCNLHVDLCFESHFKVLAVLLCLVIQYSKNLQTLRIEDSEALLEVGGKEAFDLLRNFKSHHSLTSLTLLEIGDTGRELLEKLEAVSVTDLILSQSASSDDTDSPLHQSLQSTITYMDLLSAPDLIYTTNLRCPQLTHLSLIADEPIITDLLVLAFPKLRFLEVRMNLVEDEFADMAHESNRVALARLDKTWDNLLLLSGQAIDLYTLALSCDVEMLDVHSISPADVPFVIHLLEHNSTAIVKLRINLKKFTIPVFEEFIRMACEVLDTCCSDLTLRFVLTGSTIVLQDLIVSSSSDSPDDVYCTQIRTIHTTS